MRQRGLCRVWYSDTLHWEFLLNSSSEKKLFFSQSISHLIIAPFPSIFIQLLNYWGAQIKVILEYISQSRSRYVYCIIYFGYTFV